MALIKKPTTGMKDILPREMQIRDYLIGIIKDTYAKFGFTPIETPAVENIANLSSKQGGENEKLIFKIMKRGEKLNFDEAESADELVDGGLRYDLTVPLVRFYSNNAAELPSPFKALQIGPVWRADRPQKGRFRQFYQCDIDILGEPGNLAEIELILATTTTLGRIGFKNFKIKINERRILKAMAAYSGFPEEQFDNVFIILDKMDKIGADGVKAELVEKQLPAAAIEALYQFISAGEVTLDEVAAKCADPAIADDLKYIIKTASEVSGGKYAVKYCPNLVRGQGYYTGCVFEIASPLFSGAIGGGGRYDNLIGKFIGQSVPAVGFSIGFERICSILLDQNYQIPGAKEKCAFLYEDEVSYVQVMKDAEKLRESYNVSVLKKAKKAGPQFDKLEKQGYTKFAMYKEGSLIVK